MHVCPWNTNIMSPLHTYTQIVYIIFTYNCTEYLHHIIVIFKQSSLVLCHTLDVKMTSFSIAEGGGRACNFTAATDTIKALDRFLTLVTAVIAEPMGMTTPGLGESIISRVYYK